MWADLVRNPRRTLATTVGVALGVGLSCAVLFFVDGLSATMTQRAVAPLAVDMQRVLTDPIGSDLALSQHIPVVAATAAGESATVDIELHNDASYPAHDVTVRSRPPEGTTFVPGSASVDGRSVSAGNNPFASGTAGTGMNLGTIEPGATVRLHYDLKVTASTVDLARTPPETTFSSRETPTPVAANASGRVDLSELARRIAQLDRIAHAEPLSFADLAPASLRTAATSVEGPVRVFGLGEDYVRRDDTVALVDGGPRAGEAIMSVEAARAAGVRVGGDIQIGLPDGSTLDLTVSGTADLTRARALFASRKGADLEAFVYVPNAVMLDPATFDAQVLPAFERAAATGDGPVLAPPVREVDVQVDRKVLDADPATALAQTQDVAGQVTAVGSPRDFLIDNISNTLAVARSDAALAKRLFVFLGLPGGLLAAVLAGYAGGVLAAAQRREQATLRVRGASRTHLVRMLAMRVAVMTTLGAVVGVGLGYLSASLVLGHDALLRTTTASLVVSGLAGTSTGLVATAAALYTTGRRAIDREINADRARLVTHEPLWRRWHLDAWAVAAVAAGTIAAVATSAFEGRAGSVYVGRSVDLPLVLLALPIGAWAAGSLAGARGFRWLVARDAQGAVGFGRQVVGLYRLSIRRRAWAVADATVVLALIVGLGTSLALFTASYDRAKAHDSRYVTGSDLRITPGPGDHSLKASDAAALVVPGVDAVTPVVFGVHNSIVRSARTSDVANLAALPPVRYHDVAPVEDAAFLDAPSASAALTALANEPDTVLLSQEMAGFLEVDVGDRVQVLLDRGSPSQTEIEAVVAGRFVRLPGFPDGVQALLSLDRYRAALPGHVPDHFLAATTDRRPATLQQAAVAIRALPTGRLGLRVDTRDTALVRDQSSLAALNIRGLVDLDSGYGLAMGVVAIGIFVFGLLLQRRREYVTMRVQGMRSRAIRTLIIAETATVAAVGCLVGLAVGIVMGAYIVAVLRPLFVLTPTLRVPPGALATIVVTVVVAALLTALTGSALVGRLRPTELLRDE